MKSSKYFIACCLVAGLSGCANVTPELTQEKPSPEAITSPTTVMAFKKGSPETQSDNAVAVVEPTNIWDRIRSGYAIESIDHPRIESHLKRYSTHASYMARVTKRSRPYLYHIVNEIEARGMPMELAMLPIVESAFDPFAYSHGRASGMWQFIPSTGKQYGLKQNWWYDGRRDVVASTDAALTYLSDIYRRNGGDWLLALAAYNAGEGNVRKAIRKNKAKGLPTDFWSLNLPSETKAYVPQLIAVSRIVMNPEQYNIDLENIEDTPYFEVVNIGSQIDLAQAANLAEIDINELYKLNPGYNRWATDPDGPHRLVIPLDNSDTFKQALSELPSTSRVTWQRYKVVAGDSLIAIAKRNNTSTEVLKDNNKINGHIIRTGQMLLIPKASKPFDHYAFSETQRVQRQQNTSKGKIGSRKISYRVKQGDSFWSISRNHNVSISRLAKWNAMAPNDPIKINQELVIWTNTHASNVGSSSRELGNPMLRKVFYKVRSGDSLARIAGKFNLSVKEILSWNIINKNGYIHPGQSLTLFVDVTRGS